MKRVKSIKKQINNSLQDNNKLKKTWIFKPKNIDSFLILTYLPTYFRGFFIYFFSYISHELLQGLRFNHISSIHIYNVKNCSLKYQTFYEKKVFSNKKRFFLSSKKKILNVYKHLKSFSFFYDICLKHNTLYNWRFILFLRTLFYRAFVGRVIGKLYYINVCYSVMGPIYKTYHSIEKENHFETLKSSVLKDWLLENKYDPVYNCSFEKTNDYLKTLNEVFFFFNSSESSYHSFVFFYENIAILSHLGKTLYVPYVCYIDSNACDIDFNNATFYKNFQIHCEYLVDHSYFKYTNFIEESLFYHTLNLFNSKYKYRLHISNVINIIIKSQFSFNQKKRFNNSKRSYFKKVIKRHSFKRLFHQSKISFLPHNKMKPFLWNGLIVHKKLNKSLKNNSVIKNWMKSKHIIHFLLNEFDNGFFYINGKAYVFAFNLTSNKISDLNVVDHLSPLLDPMTIYNSLVMLTKDEFLSLIKHAHFSLASHKVFYKDGSFIKNPKICLNEELINIELHRLLKNVYIKDFNGIEVKGNLKDAILGSFKMYYVVYHYNELFLKTKIANLSDGDNMKGFYVKSFNPNPTFHYPIKTKDDLFSDEEELD